MKKPWLYGFSDVYLDTWQDLPVHRGLLDDLDHLAQSAAEAGFELAIASAYRSFTRQQAIWNGKAQGLRPVLDDEEQVVDINRLTSEELMYRILRWSALPGGSRHHWGTDFDVFDRTPVNHGYPLQLTVAETQADGVFGLFYSWLNQYIQDNPHRFFRPYLADRGGIAAEPWHLSHVPTASACQAELEREELLSIVMDADIALKDVIAQRWDDIFARYIWVPWDVYP